jgi:hypothetical protein
MRKLPVQLPRFLKRYKMTQTLVLPLNNKPLKILSPHTLRLSVFLVILLIPLLSRCTIPIKDDPVYVDRGPDGAIWIMQNSKGHGDLTKANWDFLRQGMVCESTLAYAHLKEAIETLCKNTGKCTFERAPATP